MKNFYNYLSNELIEVGADVNAKCIGGMTAMRSAKDEETRIAIMNAVNKRQKKDNEKSTWERISGLFQR